MNERTKTSSFQDPKCQSEHTYGKNNQHRSKSSSFQDHHPQKRQSSSFQDPLSRPLIQSITQRVKQLNSKYYIPTNEQTKIISEPVRALRDQPQDEPAVAPPQVSRFNPIYVEPGSIQISSTKDLQTL